MTKSVRCYAVFLSFFVFWGCSTGSQNAINTAPAKRYTLQGTVVGVNNQDHTVTIAGEEIPGWMGAMTMDYPVKSDADWKRLKPKEKITASVVVSGFDYHIENVKVE